MQQSPGITPRIPLSVERKFEQLQARLRELLREGLVVAFSGGVDSAFLLWAAETERAKSGGRLLALTAISESMAGRERNDARDFARALGVEHQWHKSQELERPGYAANDGERCYHCKSELFQIARNVAGRDGYRWLAYGYNASDIGDIRPGHRAALENEVVSPLADAGLAKEDIRILMRAFGVALAEKPASPCLSSRLMTGVRVTPDKLRDIEELEALLRDGGMNVFRVRLHEHGDLRFLRLEVDPSEMAKALELRDTFISEGRRRGYRWVTLDLAGYQTGGGVVR